MFYFVSCMNIIFNSLLAQLVECDVHTTRKIKSIHAIFYHVLLFYFFSSGGDTHFHEFLCDLFYLHLLLSRVEET